MIYKSHKFTHFFHNTNTYTPKFTTKMEIFNSRTTHTFCIDAFNNIFLN